MSQTRISLRRFAGDQQEHAYRASQLAESGRQHLVPVCAETRSTRYRHSRRMLSADDLPCFGVILSCCPGCVVWARRNTHVVIVLVGVFAQAPTEVSVGHDTCELPASALCRFEGDLPL